MLIQHRPLNIVCSAKAQDAEQVITLIKSICYHHATPVHIHLFNRDFATEWFKSLNFYLKPLQCEIFDVKLSVEQFEAVQKAGDAEMDFYRFAVPVLQDLDRALYLDINTLVHGSLIEFYMQSFSEYPVIAVPDFFLNHARIQHKYGEIEASKPYLNAGVLLFNQAKCADLMLELFETAKKYDNLTYPVQDIMNIVLANQWKTAHKKYNYQLGLIYNTTLHEIEKNEILMLQGEQPVIIQYSDGFVPWREKGEHIPLAKLYWFYYRLTWEEITKRHYFYQ